MDHAEDDDLFVRRFVSQDVFGAGNALFAEARHTARAASVSFRQSVCGGLDSIEQRVGDLRVVLGEMIDDLCEIAPRSGLPPEALHALRAFAASILARISAITSSWV